MLAILLSVMVALVIVAFGGVTLLAGHGGGSAAPSTIVVGAARDIKTATVISADDLAMIKVDTVPTGTIKVKGSFPNDDRRLWPGQFCNVIVRLTTDPGAIVVPTAVPAPPPGPSGHVPAGSHESRVRRS